ncbi:hypothetical protein [Paenibacillus durus]|uniref:hypothetical protein n=1 Tax=Paenibacillus durus TaxID=44251 RepID=UPI000A5A6797|nr:hypothetical protein [Paenibacillus durus]
MHAHKPRLEQLKLVRLLVSIYRIKAVRALFPVLIIALVYWEGQHELKGIRLAKTLHELRLIPAQGVMQMMATALAAVAAMSAYDFLIRAHYRMKIGVWSTFRYSWIANTFNNLIGFAGLAGVGLRTLLYKKSGVPAAVLTPAIVFLSPLMITGLSLLSWASLFGILPAEGLLRERRRGCCASTAGLYSPSGVWRCICLSLSCCSAPLCSPNGSTGEKERRRG